MRAACTTAVLAAVLLAAALLSGCGGVAPPEREEEIVDFIMRSILIPKEGGTPFLVEWRRRSSGMGDTDPLHLGRRFWKWEGDVLSEVSEEEYRGLAAQRVGGDERRWTYRQHSITVMEQDGAAGEAVVEVGSMYGPLAGSGIRYLLRKKGGEWTEVSEETVWSS